MSDLHFFEVGMTELLRSETGPVGRFLIQKVLKVHGIAVQLCPVDTGRLRSSLRWVIGKDDLGLVGMVGSDVEYAPFVFKGTRHMPARDILRQALEQSA